MNSRRQICVIVAAIAALGMTCTTGHAADPKAVVNFVAANSSPPVPAGLKVTCLKNPDQLQSSSTCPVVKYQGITTWAYSYLDNRVSLALVSYDSKNKVIRNVEKPGTRYIFNATSSLHTKTVVFVGQSKQYVTVPWSELGAK